MKEHELRTAEKRDTASSGSTEVLVIDAERIGRIAVDNRIYEKNWQSGCNLPACRSRCCQTGVSLTEGEIEKIYEFKDDVEAAVGVPLEQCFKKDMTVTHLRMSYAAYWRRTEERDGYCIFFNPSVGCVLQEVATRKGLHKWTLKPLYSVAYPLHWQDNTLMSSPSYAGGHKGLIDCRKPENATTSMVVACREEIEWICGKENYKRILEHGRRLGYDLPEPVDM